MIRILVTGSRDWTDSERIENALVEAVGDTPPGDVTIVHGDCPTGADYIANWLAGEYGWKVDPFTVTREDWKRIGPSAGPKRNIRMIESGADRCEAFIRNHSRGSTHCARAAERAGIPTRIHRETS